MAKNRNGDARARKVKRRQNRIIKKQKRQEFNVDKKSSHNREVKKLLHAAKKFLEHPNGTLSLYAGILDNNGGDRSVLGPNADRIIELLDQIAADRDQYNANLAELEKEANEFLADDGGEAWEWTMDAIGLCDRLDTLASQAGVTYHMNAENIQVLASDSIK